MKAIIFMRTNPRTLSQAAFILALSMSAPPNLVNAQPQSLTSVNKDKSSSKQELRDSVGETKAGITQFIEALMKNGVDGHIGGNLAPVIGLSKPMPTKDVEIVIRQRGRDIEKRGCFVVYENLGSETSEAPGKRAICAYFVKIKRSRLDKQTQYFRVDLNGKLETVFLSNGKFDENGKIIRGSGVKTDLDVDSSEVRKTFEAEMKFWLKDWLKKEQKSAAKKTAAAASKKPSASAL